MTSSQAFNCLWFVIAVLGAILSTVGTCWLDPLVRSAGARRTWLRCLIRTSRR